MYSFNSFTSFAPPLNEKIMITPRFPVLFLLTASYLLIFSACDKAFFAADSAEEAVVTEDCPSLTSHLFEMSAAQKDRNALLLQYFTPAEIADLKANTCLTKESVESSEGVDERASGLKGRFWAPGSVIRVRFLNGSAALQQKVFACAEEWENYADVRFSKVTSGTSEVRIFFGEEGHWSYIGTDNRSIDACEETMNLELTDQTSGTEIRRVALHEFGHVLGMRHEHQQPLASIPWNSSAVYAYYAQQDWTREEVDQQVLNKNTAESTQYTNFDAASIMEYPVSASLTTNGYSIGWNTQLSATDKSYIGLMYSTRRVRIRHAAAGYGSNISIYVAGIYHTLKPGESLSVPVLSTANTLAIWEQPAGTWVWDDAYSPVYGKNYKIVRVGSTNDLTLAVE